ncbi:hypothetical protein WR25_09279 [Diploscapter pachys]|uniref:Peroxiredoxin-like 2A n=1 Tax=Diploscapter pachys TaxID=2018661 RepID=A0A2A2LE36_9BILA|nr:hypothetical protein WR25_09279 [Diploscapter pachys]
MAGVPVGASIGGVAAAALGGIIIYANLPTKYTIGKHELPTYSYLSETTLKPFTKDGNLQGSQIKTAELFKKSPHLVMAVRRPGCLLCRREAAALSTLLPLLQEKGIQLVAVVHETKGVPEFQPWFKGDVYFDEEKRFYGPKQRWMPTWLGFLRVGTYMNVYKAKKEGASGNMEGEGRLLGGLFFVANDNIPYAYLEKEWGDAADIDEVRQAIEKYKL